jgi:glycosyltransferase involved in cell wall biosynthesis
MEFEDVKMFRTAPGILDEKKLKSYDVVCFHGRVHPDNFRIARRSGLKVVYDVDDYFYAPSHHSFAVEWKLVEHHNMLFNGIKSADLVTTTCDTLAAYIEKHTGVKAVVLPNAIGEQEPQFQPIETKSERLRFGFIGGASHFKDVEIVGRAIGKLWQDFPEYREYWQIVFGGFSTEINAVDSCGRKIGFKTKDLPSVLVEKSLTCGYSICSPDHEKVLRRYTTEQYEGVDNYRRIWASDVFNYGSMYNEVDVCFAPLIEDTFNKCKSPLKITEAGWMGKEVICSEIVTFRDPETDPHVHLCNTVGDWVDAMVDHIESFIETGEPMKSGLQDVIRSKYGAKKWAHKRYELYKAL